MALDNTDLDQVSHILLGSFSFLMILYVLFYRWFIKRETLGILHRIWFFYYFGQWGKCMTYNETSQEYSTPVDEDWPGVITYCNMFLAQYNSIVWCILALTIFTVAGKGNDYDWSKYPKKLLLWLAFGLLYVIAGIVVVFLWNVEDTAYFFNRFGAFFCSYFLLIPAMIRMIYLNGKGRLTLGDTGVSGDELRRVLWVSLIALTMGSIFGGLSSQTGALKIMKGPYGMFVLPSVTYYAQYLDTHLVDFASFLGTGVSGVPKIILRSTTASSGAQEIEAGKM